MNFDEMARERELCSSPMQPGDKNRNPNDISLWRLVREDLKTHDDHLSSPGFLALAVHRFGNWRMDVNKPYRAPLTVAYHAAHWMTKALWGIDMPYTSQIGRRLKIEHHGAVLIGAWAIGNDVVIKHSVTVGLVRRGTKRAPIIGDRVELGAGACVVGKIIVGNDCIVGPNTVQTQSMPDGSACLGNPCRMVDRSVLNG